MRQMQSKPLVESLKTWLEAELARVPPGTSKWNKIEHRLFSFISRNWRGKPLDSYQSLSD